MAKWKEDNMTVIVALRTKDGVWLAGDKLGSNGHTGHTYIRPKVFKKDNFIFGVCGSYRLMQLLEFNLNIDDKGEKQLEDNYIYSNFAKSVRTVLKENGQMKSENGVDAMDGVVIFAYKGRLFELQRDFSMLEPELNFLACGTGSNHAEGSLYSTENLSLSPEDRLKKAIEYANNFIVSVNDKIDILFQKGEKSSN